MIIIGITGAFSAGKTTVANRLQGHYGERRCLILSLEHYRHVGGEKTAPARTDMGHYHESNYDMVSLCDKLDRLKSESESEIVILDGVFLFHTTLLQRLDVKLFIDTPIDLCLVRCLKHNPVAATTVLAHYETMVRPTYYQTIYPTKEQASLIIDNQKQGLDLDLIPVLDYISHKMSQPLLHRQSPHLMSPTFDASQVVPPKTGTLFVISGPSGVGKSTLLKNVLNMYPIEKLVPYTTRLLRSDEMEGIDYRFISHAHFAELLATRSFLQHFQAFGNDYGIPAAEVLDKLEQGQSLIMDLAPETLVQVRKKVPNMKSIFICPPAMTTIMHRLTARGGDVGDNIKRYDCSMRMLETASYQGYDYLIINDDLTKATQSLAAIVSADESTLERKQRENTVFFKRFMIHRALVQVKETLLPSLDVDQCVITPLPSLTNLSYRITHEDKTYFLRVLRHGNDFFRISPEHEYAVMNRGDALGAYPETLYHDATTGTYLAPFLLNHRLISSADILSSVVFNNIIEAIIKLHQSKRFAHDHSPFAQFVPVVMQLKNKGISLPTDMDSMMVTCHRIAELLEKTRSNTVPCNNDLSPYNMLYQERNGEIIISDWDCAGNNDPFWDLAKFSVEASLTAAQDMQVLKAYPHGIMQDMALSRLMLFKFMVEFHLALWAKWQVAIKNNATSTNRFEHMFLVRFDNCRKHLSSTTFEHHLECVRAPKGAQDLLLFHKRFYPPVSNRLLPIHEVQPASSRSTVINQHALFQTSTRLLDEQTLVILKPNILESGNVGSVIGYLEGKGFRFVAQTIKQLTLEDITELYPQIKTEPERYYDVLDLMTSGPVVILVLEGPQVAMKVRALKGATDPKIAEENTLRKLFGTNAKWNAVHCSDNAHEAQREIALLFHPPSAPTPASGRRDPSVLGIA